MRAWLLLFLASVLSVACSLPQDQIDSLNALYQSTSGSSWDKYFGWNSTTDPCGSSKDNGWFGVKCDSFNTSVISLVLTNNGLSGSLPDLRLPDLIYL